MNNYSSVRVGVAGATGYAGLELLRRLARHPHVDLRFAMASSASEAKRLPALARIWDAPVEPLDVNKLGSEADAVFLALPDTLAAEIVPALADRGARVFDLSGAFRLRDVALRQRWYPHTGDTSMPIVMGLACKAIEHTTEYVPRSIGYFENEYRLTLEQELCIGANIATYRSWCASPTPPAS